VLSAGAGDQTIMDIAGHVSRQMLARYTHIRMDANRKALEGIQKARARRRGATVTQEGTKLGTVKPTVDWQ
jgi:hypothetical protein